MSAARMRSAECGVRSASLTRNQHAVCCACAAKMHHAAGGNGVRTVYRYYARAAAQLCTGNVCMIGSLQTELEQDGS